jgi:hypothetical protein
MRKKFYFYSDPARYEDQIALGRTPMLKIGQTTQETTTQRVKQQDGTSCAQELDIKGSFIVKDASEDTDFHINLENKGYLRTRQNREWFYITVEQAETELKLWESGAVTVKKYFTPRPHQAWVNAEILKRWDGEQTIIQPLNLAARFGKTLQALSLFKDSGLEVMVVAAHWLAANNSFIKTINARFDIAADITVIKPDYDEFKAAIDKGQRVLIDVSLHTDAEKIDPRLTAALNVYKKLIYIDEADFGAWTKSSRETAAQFIDSGINLVCVATGTNIDRALIGSKGNLQEPITVSYLDLVEAKRGEGKLFQPAGFCSDDPQKWMDTLSDIVDVGVLNLGIQTELKDELNALTDERRPNMPKIFAKRNSHLQRRMIQVLLFDELFGADVFGMYNTQYEPIEHPAAMMFIPGTKADVNNIVKMGMAIAPHYNWIALHGDDYNNRIAEDAVIDAIENNGKERTVIVSCSMGARSFSVPNIVAVINCKDGGSVGTAVQQASRCFTPGCGKTHGLIVNFGFNVERTSEFENDLISSAIAQDPSNSDNAVRRVYGLADFFKKDSEGYMIQWTEGDYLQYVTSVENLNNIAKATIDIDGLLSDIDLLEILKGVASNPNTSKEWKGAIKKAMTWQPKEDKQERKVDDEKKAMRDLLKKVCAIIDCTANTYYLAPNETKFKDCLADIAMNPAKNAEYVKLVGVDAEVVYNDLYKYLPIQTMDLTITKTKEFDSMDKFAFINSDHAPKLFDL